MNKLGILLSLLVIALLGSAFYWYEWRPQQIVKFCNEEARKKANEVTSEKVERYNELISKLEKSANFLKK